VKTSFEKIAAATGVDLAADALASFEERLAALAGKFCGDAEQQHFRNMARKAFVIAVREIGR
jgi:hypothetical protein